MTGPVEEQDGRSDLDRALSATTDYLGRYVVFASPEQADAVALWTGHTWTYDQFDATPYLAIQSPEKRSGKSRLLECLRLVTRAAVPMAGASLAALFRIIDERHPTVLLDEADTIFNKRTADATEDIRGLLNNGYRRGVPFYRVVGEGKKMRVESFDVFCPKAVASIRALPDTVQDRSIVIAMKRRARHESVARFRFRVAEQEAATVREWWEVLAEGLRLPEQADVPDQLDDRAADSWEPLLALADAAGGEWPDRARRAALALSGVVVVEDEKVGVLLLADIRDVFAQESTGRIATKQLMERLLGDDYDLHPWQEWNHGRGLKPTGMGRLLSPFGIRAQQLWLDGVNVRGYELEQFADAFSRYLPPPVEGGLDRYSASPERESEHGPSHSAVQMPSRGRGENGAEGQRPRGLNGHPPDAVSIWAADAAPAIDCDDYRAHQSHHRQVGGGWRCDVCAGAVPA